MGGRYRLRCQQGYSLKIRVSTKFTICSSPYGYLRISKMKKILTILLLVCSLQIQAQDISYVKTASSWYVIYDSSGKKTGSVSASLGELVGYGSEFLVLRKGSWYILYDSKGRRLRGLSRSTIGEVIAVSGNTFTSRLGSWIYVWSKEGKKLSSHYGK